VGITSPMSISKPILISFVYEKSSGIGTNGG